MVRVANSTDATGAIVIGRALADRPDRVSHLESRGRDGGLFVACGDDRPVGFLCLEAAGFFERPFVTLLVVGPEYRRSGVATALMDAAEATLAPCRVFTSTNRSNGPMLALPAGRGYTPSGALVGLDDGDPEEFFFKDQLPAGGRC